MNGKLTAKDISLVHSILKIGSSGRTSDSDKEAVLKLNNLEIYNEGLLDLTEETAYTMNLKTLRIGSGGLVDARHLTVIGNDVEIEEGGLIKLNGGAYGDDGLGL